MGGSRGARSGVLVRFQMGWEGGGGRNERTNGGKGGVGNGIVGRLLLCEGGKGVGEEKWSEREPPCCAVVVSGVEWRPDGGDWELCFLSRRSRCLLLLRH